MISDKKLLLPLLLMLATLFHGCEREFDEPPFTFCTDPENLSGQVITIAQLRGIYDTSLPAPVYIDEDLIITGISISSDKEGNIYKTLYIQDSTAGIAISVDATELHNDYGPGTRVWVLLKGLYVGEYGGTGLVQIGGALSPDDPMSVDRIPEVLVRTHILNGSCGNPVDTLHLAINQINTALHQSRLIKLTGVEFATSELGKTYAVPGGGSGQNRILQDCNLNTIIMRNSDFASFAGQPLPSGNGWVVGIVGVFNDPQILIRDLRDVHLTGTRCDGSSPNQITLLSEDFESFLPGSTLNISGWTNAAEVGTVRWTVDEFNSNRFAEASTFNAGQPNNILWLVTPAIDLDNTTNEKLTFETQVGFPDNATLQLLISTDYDGMGNPWNFTWTPLPFTEPQPPQTGNWGPWTPSGDVNLSAYSGTVYIAWKYTGGTAVGTETIELDNIKITGEQ